MDDPTLSNSFCSLSGLIKRQRERIHSKREREQRIEAYYVRREAMKTILLHYFVLLIVVLVMAVSGKRSVWMVCILSFACLHLYF